MVTVPSLEMSLWVFVWDERDLHGVPLDMVLFLVFLLGSVGVYCFGYGCFCCWKWVVTRVVFLSGMRLDT
jgi:hypothetical protein